MIDGDTIVNMLPSFLALLDKDLIRFWERTKEGSFFFFSNYMERKGLTNPSSHHPWDDGSKKKTHGNIIDGDTIVNMLLFSFTRQRFDSLLRANEEGSFFFFSHFSIFPFKSKWSKIWIEIIKARYLNVSLTISS
jgi:hypothetical protein